MAGVAGAQQQMRAVSCSQPNTQLFRWGLVTNRAKHAGSAASVVTNAEGISQQQHQLRSPSKRSARGRFVYVL